MASRKRDRRDVTPPPAGASADRVYRAPLDSFTADPENANRGTKRGRTALDRSIRDLGAARSMVADRNGVLPAGNKTREALLAAGVTEAIVVETDGTTPVVVKRTDWDLAEKNGKARQYAYADNRVAELDLEWDASRLAQDLNAGLDLTGFFSDREITKALASITRDGTGNIPDAGERPRTPVTKTGDRWRLGHHIVICADMATVDPAEVRIGKLGFGFTSPPYNADIKVPNAAKAAKAREVGVELATSRYQSGNDSLTDDEYAALLRAATLLLIRSCAVAVINVQVLANNKRVLARWGAEFAQHLVDRAVWHKGAGAPQMAARVLNSRFEDLFIYAPDINPSRVIATAEFHGDVSNVYEGPGAMDNPYSDIHNAVMPVHLATFAVGTLGKLADYVVEPFGGTGTTLVVADAHHKRCATIERDPGYVDVIVERWQSATGGKAQRA